MKAGWQSVPLGKLLRRADRFENRDDLKEYQFAGTYSFARGIFLGARKLGSSFGLPKVQTLRGGDFVYCKIMAWEGAFGLVPADLDGAVLSGAFVAYEIDKTRLEPAFLDYYFKVPAHWQEVGRQSTGTNVRRQSLHPEQFEAAQIPLPPLNEQRRIVARIKAIAGKIEDAKRLRTEAEQAADNLCRSILSHARKVERVPMASLVRLRPTDITVQPNQVYRFAGVYSFGRGVFRSVRKSGSEFSYERLTTLREGDFVYPKLMAWEGALGIVPPECDGCAVSPEFPTFEVDQSRVLPEVLDVHFRTPAVWPDIAALSTGTNVRRRRVHPSAFMTYMFPLPDMATQQRMVGARSALRRASDVGASPSTELDAILPAVLDKAFRGEM